MAKMRLHRRRFWRIVIDINTTVFHKTRNSIKAVKFLFSSTQASGQLTKSISIRTIYRYNGRRCLIFVESGVEIVAYYTSANTTT